MRLMKKVSVKKEVQTSRAADIRSGIRLGLAIAGGYSVLTATGVTVGTATGAGTVGEVGRLWVLAPLFYVAAGMVGGKRERRL